MRFAVTFCSILFVFNSQAAISSLSNNFYFKNGDLSISENDSIKPRKPLILKIALENGAMVGAGSNALIDSIFNASYYNAVNVRFGWQLHAPNIYGQVHRYPVLGIGWFAATFNNKDIGNPNAIYGFVELPMRKEIKKWNWTYSIGFGLSYNFNPYDSVANPGNILIGSYKNFYIDLGANIYTKVADNMDLGIGLGFKHFSNGSMQRPNNGINLIPLSLTAKVFLNDVEPDYSYKPLPEFIPHNSIAFAIGPASKQYKPGTPNSFKMSIMLEWMHQFTYKYRWGIGGDVLYSTYPEYVDSTGTYTTLTNLSYAATGNWDWVITRNIYMHLAVGFYLKRNPQFEESEIFYERISLRARVFKQLYAGIGLKAHYGVADCIEWTLAYRFVKDPNNYTIY